MITIDLKMWQFLSSFCLFIAVGAEENYPTNFMEAFRWKSKQIHYGTPGRVNEIKFRNLISDSINKFNDIFGNYFEWIFEEDAETLKEYERYLVFDKRILTSHDACFKSYWPDTLKVFNETSLLGQNTIVIAVEYSGGQIACDCEDVIRFILATLGFYPLTSRIDRDEHLRFLWDRKFHVSKEYYPKRYDLANSTNPVFKNFDLSSIHLVNSICPDPDGRGWSPLYVPVNNSTKNWKSIWHLNDSVSEIDVKQFQAIYHN